MAPTVAAGDDRRDQARLLVSCVDRPGIVSAVSTFLAEHGANIVSLDQFSTDPEGGSFYQRTEFHLDALPARIDELRAAFETAVGVPFEARWSLASAERPKRVAIFASRTDHCVLDLLWRVRRGELAMEVVVVVSNHPDLAESVRQFGVPFVHIPVSRDTKAEAEQRQLDLVAGNVDLVVLARYMQIVSGDFLARVGCPVINIHHSFLPAFIGPGPYQRAKDRGVKLIGATAHYVTEDLDEGPIIEQDVVRVSHREDARELERRGADVERLVLSRAVAWHVDDRVIRDGNATIVF